MRQKNVERGIGADDGRANFETEAAGRLRGGSNASFGRRKGASWKKKKFHQSRGRKRERGKKRLIKRYFNYDVG